MSMQAHHRSAVVHIGQHIYRHTASDFAYTNPGAPGATNVASAVDWLFAVLYPQMKPAVANVAALPAGGNTINDYRVVTDATGTGKAGGFRWEQREGEASASWHQVSEIDWGADSVLQEWQARNQDAFFMRKGYDDIDGTGAKLVGVTAGQAAYGGASANSNLNLYPNSGDGAGAQTGYIQFFGNNRPSADNSWTLGTAANKYSAVYGYTGVFGTATLSGGQLADSSGSFSFNALNLSTTGTLAAGNTTITGFMQAGNVKLSGDTVSTTDTNGDLILAPNGTGSIKTVRLYPAADATSDVGKTGARYANVYLSGSLGDGTNTISIATILALRSIQTGVSSGYGIFWNGTQWVAADPDTEVFHPSIQSLTTGGTDSDAGHSQFALLAGRTGAQTLYGGKSASQNLTLSSTNNATKGFVISDSSFVAAASVDGAVDLGNTTTTNNRWRNIYMTGQGIGFRTENYTTGGRPGAGNAGRHYWDTTTSQVYTDDGAAWRKTGVEATNITDTTGWTGSVSSVTYTVSSTCADARNCIWVFTDSSNKQIQGADITPISATQVTVSFDVNIAAATYHLKGVG